MKAALISLLVLLIVPCCLLRGISCYIQRAARSKDSLVHEYALIGLCFTSRALQDLGLSEFCLLLQSKTISACARHENLPFLKKIRQKGLVSDVLTDDWPALYWAAWTGNTEIIRLLWEMGIEPRASEFFEDKTTELHICAELGRMEALVLLLSLGIYEQTQNQTGVGDWVDALCSVRHSKEEIVRFLLQCEKAGLSAKTISESVLLKGTDEHKKAAVQYLDIFETKKAISANI